MQREAAVAEVGDLVAAIDAGATTRSSAAVPRTGEEHALAAGLALLVVALLVANAARYPAASAVQDRKLEPLPLRQHVPRGPDAANLSSRSALAPQTGRAPPSSDDTAQSGAGEGAAGWANDA